MPHAGQLRHRLTAYLVPANPTYDAYGQVVDASTALWTVWAGITPTAVNEGPDVSNQIQNDAQIAILVRESTNTRTVSLRHYFLAEDGTRYNVRGGPVADPTLRAWLTIPAGVAL